MKKPLGLVGARALSEAGAIADVQVIADTEGLRIELNDSFVVANRQGRPRYFAKPDTCFNWIRGVGLTKITGVDLSRWGEIKKPTAPKRVPKKR